ncbi:MAG: hypothetical protein AAB914_00005, partial [Patescibacteria group bacterium]
MVSLKKFYILFFSIIFVFSLLGINLSSFNTNNKVSADYNQAILNESSNYLWLIGKHCGGIEGSGSTYETCGFLEGIMKKELGCSGLFFTKQGDQSKWYVKPGAYADCYQLASKQIKFLEDKCKKIQNDKDPWDTCENNQGHLSQALGCDPKMFSREGDYWKIKPNSFNSCKTHFEAVGNLQLLDSTGSVSTKKVSETDPTKATTDTSGTEPDCDTTFTNPMSWILCPVMHGGAKFTDFVFGSLVKPLLQSNPIGTDSDNGFYKAWQSFRAIANILLIGILLILVLSQLTEGWGLNVVDAYTAKKMAPRILIGVIGINLSIYLCIAAIDITNVIGSGLEYLMTKPFADAQILQNAKLEANAESTIVSGVGLGVAGGGAFALSSIGTISAAAGSAAILLEGAFFFLVPFFIGMFFAGLAIIVTLVIRFGLVVFLTIISPLAIACFILPGTEKYFKAWWGLFLKTLFVYPIIAVIFAMSDIMAVIFVQNSNEISDAAGLVSVLVGVVAVYMPLFLIPFAFKFAGGAIGAIAKIASDKSQGWAGKTKEAYDKHMVQNPDNFVYKRKANRKSNLEDQGLTKGQISSGLTRGWKGMRQSRRDEESLRKSLNRFGEAGREDIESSSQGFLKARKEELMKTKEGMQMAGNEDPFIAYRHAAYNLPDGSDEELRQSMQQFLQNPDNVDGREYTPDQARQYATNMTKLAERANRKTMLGLTTDQISGSGTGYNQDLSKGKLGGLSEAIADIVDDNDSGRNTQDVVSGALSARALGAQAERPD